MISVVPANQDMEQAQIQLRSIIKYTVLMQGKPLYQMVISLVQLHHLHILVNMKPP